jgi:dipeptidyl-peptidase 4
VTVRSVLASPVVQHVVAEITEPAGDGAGGFSRRKRTGVYRAVRMPVYDRFVAARREAMPAAYLVPARLGEIVELLRRQAVTVERLAQPWLAVVETFGVESLAVGPLFEGHHTVQVEGRWSAEERDTSLAAGWYVVSTDQPLGALAAYLLEPASEDGVVTWNLLDRELQGGADYPLLRVRAPPRAPRVALP